MWQTHAQLGHARIAPQGLFKSMLFERDILNSSCVPLFVPKDKIQFHTTVILFKYSSLSEFLKHVSLWLDFWLLSQTAKLRADWLTHFSFPPTLRVAQCVFDYLNHKCKRTDRWSRFDPRCLHIWPTSSPSTPLWFPHCYFWSLTHPKISLSLLFSMASQWR